MSFFLNQKTKKIAVAILPKLAKIAVPIMSVTMALSYPMTASGGSLAYADTVRRLTPQETRQYVGDVIPAQYYDGTDYVNFTFQYGGVATVSNVLIESGATPAVASGDSVIWYSAQITPNTNPQFITVDVQPEYSFFDTQTIIQTIGLSTASYPAVSAYAPPSWRWYDTISGQTIFENLNKNHVGTGYAGFTQTGISGLSSPFTFVDANFSKEQTFSAYSYRACFYGNSATGGMMYLALSCPIITDSATMDTGTAVTSTPSGGDINVSVIVNNSDVVSAIGGLASYPAETVETVATLPADIDVSSGMGGADDLLDDIPSTITSTGFWLYFLGRIFGATFAVVPVFQTFALVLVLLSLFAYILWRK